MDIDVDGDTNYGLEIETGPKPEDAVHVPVFFTVVGDKGKGQKNLITQTLN